MSRWHREHPDYDLTLEQLEREDRALASGARAASETAASPVTLAPRRVGLIRVEQRFTATGRPYDHLNHASDETCRSCPCAGDGWACAPEKYRRLITASITANGGVCPECFGTGCASVAGVEDAIEDEKIQQATHLHTFPRSPR